MTSRAANWSWHHPDGQFSTMVAGGPVVDAEKNLFLMTMDGLWKLAEANHDICSVFAKTPCSVAKSHFRWETVSWRICLLKAHARRQEPEPRPEIVGTTSLLPARCPFSPTKLDYRKKATFVLTSPLEDLVGNPQKDPLPPCSWTLCGCNSMLCSLRKFSPAGEVLWHYQTPGSSDFEPTISGDRVMSATTAGKAFAVDRLSQNLGWIQIWGSQLITSVGLEDPFVEQVVLDTSLKEPCCVCLFDLLRKWKDEVYFDHLRNPSRSTNGS